MLALTYVQRLSGLAIRIISLTAYANKTCICTCQVSHPAQHLAIAQWHDLAQSSNFREPSRARESKARLFSIARMSVVEKQSTPHRGTNVTTSACMQYHLRDHKCHSLQSDSFHVVSCALPSAPPGGRYCRRRQPCLSFSNASARGARTKHEHHPLPRGGKLEADRQPSISLPCARRMVVWAWCVSLSAATSNVLH